MSEASLLTAAPVLPDDLCAETAQGVRTDGAQRAGLELIWTKKMIYRAIREKCLDCSGGSQAEVDRCTSTRCALHPYRFGCRSRRKAHLSREESENGDYGGAIAG